MKFTLNWLKEFLDTKADLSEILETLTNIGLEVEEVENKADGLEDFKSVHVLEVKKHPDADRLNLCKVQTEAEVVELVCGAPNVRADMKAVLAPLGSTVPVNQMKVKKVKIRGVESTGMLCSSYELGLGTEHDGIIQLPANTEIGTPVADVLNLNDPVIEIAITPNRGDCLGVYGIARDLAAAGLGKLKSPEAPKLEQKTAAKYKVEIKDSACKALNFIELSNVKNCESPERLQARLKAIGLNPKNAVVDVTNYLLYSYGQPLHAYDAAKLDGQIVKAELTGKEVEFVALNDETYRLPEGALVISDEKKVVSLAGIIGGANSASDLESSNILLEAANFCAIAVAKTGRKLLIDTDSRYRFERKIDPLFTKQALLHAADLIIEICGGEVSELIGCEAESFKERKATLSLEALGGAASYAIDAKKVTQILEHLGFVVSRETKSEIEVVIPSWRNDVSIEEDLIEEVLRVSGFAEIPYERIENLNKKEANNLDIKRELETKKLLANLGLSEVVSWSFYGEKQADLYGFSKELKLLNPISNDLTIMRESLIPNLVDIAIAEQNQNNPTTAIFEQGRIFKSAKAEDQLKVIAGVRVGPRNIKEINNENADYDIFDAKADILALLRDAGLNADRVGYGTDNLPSYLHSKRAAALTLGKNQLGYFGELHPAIAKKLGLKQRLNLFELFLDSLPPIKSKGRKLEQLELQPITRDFCFIVTKDIAAGALRQEILKSDSELIKDVKIFDLYEGDKLADNEKSLAFNVILQPKEKTLTGDELEAFNKKVIDNVTKKFGARLP